MKNDEVKNTKVKLLKDVTFPEGIKAKGEVIETDHSTADWLIQVNAAELIKEVKRGKNSDPKPADNR